MSKGFTIYVEKEKFKKRAKKSFFDLYYGLVRYKYPLCCVLRFSLDNYIYNPSLSCAKRGRIKGKHFVPCGIFHKSDDPYKHNVIVVNSLDEIKS